jgi:hypothetical protein
MFGSKRLTTLLVAMAVFLAPLGPTLGPVLAAETQEVESTADFMDKWILNGGSIGGAAGATLGQYLGTVMMPGPIGWVVGSLIGGLVGGVVGTLIDNQIHRAYNYTAFDRPPMESGGLVLEGVGPWEQGLYQVDQWVISGGNIGSLLGHFGVNLFGAFIPGGLGRFLSTYTGIFLADALFGTIGDNLDGFIDLGLLGREIDKARGTDVGDDEDEDEAPDAPAAASTAAGRDALDRALDTVRQQAYKTWISLSEAGEGQSSEAQEAYRRFSTH